MDLNTETSTSNHYEIFTSRLLILLQLQTLCGCLLLRTLENLLRTVWCFTSVALYNLHADCTENPVVLFVSSDLTGNFSRSPYCCVSTNCRRDVFTSVLRSNGRVMDHIEMVSLFRFVYWAIAYNALRKSVTLWCKFTEPLRIFLNTGHWTVLYLPK
jgi:hypothetical protein